MKTGTGTSLLSMPRTAQTTSSVGSRCVTAGLTRQPYMSFRSSGTATPGYGAAHTRYINSSGYVDFQTLVSYVDFLSKNSFICRLSVKEWFHM